MFLTGQLYPHPWEEPKKQKKIPKVTDCANLTTEQDHNYYSAKNDNLWNDKHDKKN